MTEFKPMKIATLQAVPISFPVPADKSVRLGIGRSVKRDAVLVKASNSVGLAKLVESMAKELACST